MSTPRLLLPWPVHIGPYAFKVCVDTPAHFQRKHWRSETDYNNQIIRLRAGMTEREIAHYFWLRVVRAMHYSAGVDDGCPEESFTHNYASALMAFIRANPEVWVWFNRLVEDTMKPGARYERYARGARDPQPIAPPRRFTVGKHAYQLENMPLALSKRLGCWGDCNLKTRVVRLSDELYGTQLAVIFWHELSHAIHRESKLDDGDTRAAFARAQAELTLQFMAENPQAWRWFLCLTSHAANDGRAARQRLRKAA